MGEYTNVESGFDLGVTYSFIMRGDLYYSTYNIIGSENDRYYHNMLWNHDTPINAPSANKKNAEAKSKVDAYVNKVDNMIEIYNFDTLAGLGVAGITELKVNDKVVGGIIADILKTSEVADINAVAKVEVPEFTEDRDAFVKSLCDVLEPLYGLLKFVLADEDFTFFVNENKTDAISLKGAEGYAFGIIPLLEALECENVLAPVDYYALDELRKENDFVADLIEDILGLDIFEDVLTPEGFAPNGLLAFFQKIISWFRGIVEWFKNLFN